MPLPRIRVHGRDDAPSRPLGFIDLEDLERQGFTIVPIIPTPPSPTASEDRDSTTALPVSKTLALAGTSEILFTVPAGKVARSFDFSVPFLPLSGGDAYVNFNGGTAAATDSRVPRGGGLSQSHLQLPAGDYEFIGDAGKTPHIDGTVWLSDAPV